MDNHDFHIGRETIQVIHREKESGNHTSHKMQPLDKGVLGLINIFTTKQLISQPI